jgi:hypothetical protein
MLTHGCLPHDEAPHLLPGVPEFRRAIPASDVIILLTARPESERASTLKTIGAAGLRYDHAIFALPVGERILIDDEKPGGLKTAVAANAQHDAGLEMLRLAFDPDI